MYYLVFDLEMSGGEPGWHEIIQIGAILYDENWNFLGDYLCNVCPENKEAFSRPAEEIHDLTWDELQNELLIDEVLEDFLFHLFFISIFSTALMCIMFLFKHVHTSHQFGKRAAYC